jgi:hypothetical protein
VPSAPRPRDGELTDIRHRSRDVAGRSTRVASECRTKRRHLPIEGSPHAFRQRTFCRRAFGRTATSPCFFTLFTPSELERAGLPASLRHVPELAASEMPGSTRRRSSTTGCAPPSVKQASGHDPTHGRPRRSRRRAARGRSVIERDQQLPVTRRASGIWLAASRTARRRKSSSPLHTNPNTNRPIYREDRAPCSTRRAEFRLAAADCDWLDL